MENDILNMSVYSKKILKALDNASISDSGVVIKTIKIVPSLARELLNNSIRMQGLLKKIGELTGLNRSLSQRTIMAYAYSMKTGKWKFPSPPLLIDSNGIILDGQHRISAVISSNTTQKFLIIFGATPDMLDAFDEGKKRTLGDRLKLRGYPNAYELSAALRGSMWIALFGGIPRRVDQPEMVNLELYYNYINKHHKELTESLKLANSYNLNHKESITTRSIAGALHHRIWIKHDLLTADRFIDNLATAKHRRFQIVKQSFDRITFRGKKGRREDQIRILLIAWHRIITNSKNYDIISPDEDIRQKILAD